MLVIDMDIPCVIRDDKIDEILDIIEEMYEEDPLDS